MPSFKMAQGEFQFEPRTWGGKRKGAGRPKLKSRSCEPHRARPELKGRYPVHVVMRANREVGRLRRRAAYHAVRKALAVALALENFRVVHVSIQHNHLHLIAEAEGEASLSQGMRILTIAIARRLNDAMGRRGTVFPQRYHATQLRNPRQVRNSICYVLNNWRRHREHMVAAARGAKLDPYSSAVEFDGWEVPFARPEGYSPLPVARAATWLLSVGWKKFGPIGAREVPGPD